MDYTSYSDDELVLMSQLGDRNAESFILNKYKPLVKKQATNLFISGGDYDDLIQEGMIGLFKAVRDYKSDAGAKFITFASLCIIRSIHNAIAKANSDKNKLLNKSVSFEDFNDSDEDYSNMMRMASLLDSELNNPESIIISQENASEVMDNIYKSLSSFEQEVLLYHISGYDYKSIAGIMNTDDKAIDNALQRIKKKVKKII